MDQNRIIEPAHNLLRGAQEPLGVFVRPRNVAIVGASEKPGSVGRRLVANLLGSAISRKVFLVNPTKSRVLGHTTFQSLLALPEHVELAVIAVPAMHVPDVIRECIETGVRGAIIISAG